MKRKLSPRGAALLMGCLGFGLLASVNYCAGKLTSHFGLRLDMTSNQLYELSDETQEVLDGLKKEIRIRVFSSETDFLPLVSEVLEQYCRRGNEKITVEYIDPYVNPTLLDFYIQRGYQLELGSIIVESDRYARALKLEDMFELDSSGNGVQGIRCEQQISSAILYAAGTGTPSVQFTVGHNELVSDGLKELFLQNNYEKGNIALSMERMEEETDLLVIASPTTDFAKEEIASLDKYMADGGRLLVFLGPASEEMPNLEEFLNEWGIGTTGIVVAEAQQYTDSNPLSVVPVYSAHSINQYFSGNQVYLVMPSTRALEPRFVSQGGIRTQKLLYSTDRAYDSLNRDGEKGPFTLAMTAEKEWEFQKARVVVLGSRGIYSDSLLAAGNYSNARFLTRVINWCTETDSAINIPAKRLGNTQIAITVGQVAVLAAIFVLLLPFSVIFAGFFIYRCRRHS